MPRRRHNKAFDGLAEPDFAEYRRQCLPRDRGGAGRKLERIVAWLAERGVASSVSSVARDAEYFRAVEAAKDRLRLSSRAAKDIVAAAAATGGVAATQAAAVEVYTQQVMDLLIREQSIDAEDIPKYAKLGQALARLTGSQIAVYRADVERRAAGAAERARALAARQTGDAAAQLDRLAEEILGVPA